MSTSTRRSPGPRASRAGSTLTVRAVVVTCLVAAVSVVITAVVALPIYVRAANDGARRVLAEKARVAANAVEGRPTAAGQMRVAATLRAQDIYTVLIRDGVPDQPGLPAKMVNRIVTGEDVSGRTLYKGRLMFVEGRPAGPGDGIVLLAPTASVGIATIVDKLWLALAAGLAAGVLAGAFLARRLGRPLREVAAAAVRLSAGDRRARAPTAAPAEVAAVSVALNNLATALAVSENRQRAFLMSVSHELRTPLTTIKGYAEALADGVVGVDGAQRAGQTMLAESEHLDRLVEDLLVLARLEADDFPLEFVDVDIVALVAAAAESWGGRCAAAGVILRTELPNQSVYAWTDPGRIRQVVDGLLENALRVVSPGAPIVLAVRVDQWPEPAAGAFGGRWRAVVEVRDGGPGFTDDDLAVVFERGALHERYKGVRKVGSGLGLALAARLVHRLGGRIEAGHAAEGGARFTVSLLTER